jgi:beta-lactam-binding protein with PASTA domain
VVSVVSATVPAGVIISTAPVAGSKVEQGSVVTLTKSSGPAEQVIHPGVIKVPGTP